MTDLSRDIIIDILLKLPVKSLGKFRCVSKYWCSLISDQQFIANHLRVSSSDDNYTNHQIILSCSDLDSRLKSWSASSLFKDNNYTNYKILMSCKGQDIRLKSCSVSSLFKKPSTDAVDIVHSSFREPLKFVKVVGSCNGLLCVVAEHGYVYLWNPTIRELRRLPDSGLRDETSPGSGSITYGFGYDSSIDDYKVVVILTVHLPALSHYTKVMVYTLRPNCWRRIADFPLRLGGDPGLLVGGALIWGATRYSGHTFPNISMSWHILAFELATEKQTMLPQPANEKLSMDLSLGKLRECLCLHSNYREKSFDIWVMKDYGVEESWCKMFTLPSDASHIHMRCSPFFRPLLYSKKIGELILEFGSGLVLYNPENGTLRNVWINEFRPCLESISYVESLVSPYVDGPVEILHQ